MKLEPRIRSLTRAERRLLRRKIREFDRRPGDLERSVAIGGIGVTGVLWLWTLLASDLSPNRVIPAKARWELWEEIPEFPDVVYGSIDRLEESLRGER